MNFDWLTNHVGIQRAADAGDWGEAERLLDQRLLSVLAEYRRIHAARRLIRRARLKVRHVSEP